MPVSASFSFSSSSIRYNKISNEPRSRSPSPPAAGAAQVPDGPVKMGGFDDRLSDTTPEELSDSEKTPCQAAAPVVAVTVASPDPPPPNQSKPRSTSPPVQSGTEEPGKVETITVLIIIVLVAITLLYLIGTGRFSPESLSINVSATTKRTDENFFTGTYVTQAGTGRFSTKSTSQNTASRAYKFAQKEHRLRIEHRRFNDYNGNSYYVFKWSPDRSSSVFQSVSFVSGREFNLDNNNRQSDATQGRITIEEKKWVERYKKGSDTKLLVKRVFKDDGIISVTYEAAGTIYYKKFEKV